VREKDPKDTGGKVNVPRLNDGLGLLTPPGTWSTNSLAVAEVQRILLWKDCLSTKKRQVDDTGILDNTTKNLLSITQSSSSTVKDSPPTQLSVI
jgi:hypothetical protein